MIYAKKHLEQSRLEGLMLALQLSRTNKPVLIYLLCTHGSGPVQQYIGNTGTGTGIDNTGTSVPVRTYSYRYTMKY